MLKQVGMLFTLLVAMVGCASSALTGPHRFESSIVAFEKRDAQNPPPANPILFVGSSTIRFWNLEEAFPGSPVLNRGFGGSEVSDVLTYYDRVVARYRPRVIVFYSGDNDLAAGKSPTQVAADVCQFIQSVRQTLPPETRLIIIGVKPSIARWNLIEEGRETNRMVSDLVAADRRAIFIDVSPQVLGADGHPRAELFRGDGLHFGPMGYEILNEAVRPYVVR